MPLHIVFKAQRLVDFVIPAMVALSRHLDAQSSDRQDLQNARM